MGWGGFFGSIWAGSTRHVRCPHCGRDQVVPRRQSTADITCKQCHRTFRTDAPGATDRPDDPTRGGLG